MPKAGKRANDSILFGSAGYRFGLLPGFPDATSAYSLSAQNDTGKPATLYRPAVKALVLYQCQGRRVYDCKSYSSQEIYAEPIGFFGALGQIGSTGEELYIAEYRQSETVTHIACFDKKKKQFLFAGVTDNSGESYKPYVLDYKEGRNGTVLWLALIPYLAERSAEIRDITDKPEIMRDAYKDVVEGTLPCLVKEAQQQAFIFCDSIYYTVNRVGAPNEVEVNIPGAGVFPAVPKAVEQEAYKPDQVLVGKFFTKGLTDEKVKKKIMPEIMPSELKCKYMLVPNMTEAEKSAIRQMPDTYIVTPLLLKAVHNVWYHHQKKKEESKDGQLSPSVSQMLNDPLEERGVNLSAGQAANIEGTGQITFNRDYISSGAAQAVRILTEVIGDLAEERALAVNNAAVNAALQSNIDDIDWGPIHRNVDKEINRISDIPTRFRTEYAMLCRQVQSIVEKLVKTITRTLKEENLAGERKGRFYGKKLDAPRLYRADLRVWKDMKAPKKEINLAISLLIDESGSMSGAKAEITRLTAILFAEACEKLGIPLEVNGHTTSGLFVKLFNYKIFDSFDRNDKYRLVDISARGCNRDGAAVIFGCERLLKRRENKKIFIIISDGRPNHDNYSGNAAKSDLKHIRNTYARKGVTFIAAAIDADKEYIHEIYGKNFLGISNLESMPAVFGRILQKEIIE